MFITTAEQKTNFTDYFTLSALLVYTVNQYAKYLIVLG